MAHFSFRAECPSDVERLKNECNSAGITVSLSVHPYPDFPDVDVELESSSSLGILRDQMSKVVDGHVMVQTLRECRLKDNSLERDYKLE